MSSALKPAGVTTSPVPPPINKPLHPQNAPTTYGQPMSHLPQNLSNLPHNTSTPANAHSNNLHTTNHYAVNTSSASPQCVTGVNVPPPSNHPIANVNQVSPTKNIAYNLNTNNVAHSYKIPTSSSENVSDSIVAEESPIERPQSNGTSEEQPVVQEELPQNHQAEPVIKDKSPPLPQIEVPEPPTIIIEEPSEIILPTTTPEKPIESEIVTIPEQKQNLEVDAIPEVVTPPVIVLEKPSQLMEAPAVVDNPSVTLEPIVTSASTVEPSIPAPVTVTTTTSSVVPIQTEEIPEKTSSPHLPVATESSSLKHDIPTSIISPPVTKPKEQSPSIPKPTLKLATTPRSPVRKIKPPSAETTEQLKVTKSEGKTPNQKSPSLVAKSKRTRTRTQPYQSPLPEVELISKISASASTSKTKNVEDKLIVFYRNEFLAVRNSEGGFYICQTLHNIHKSTRKIRILWLSQDKSDSDIYTPDFYDQTDFDCILTNINLTRAGKGKFKLPDKERIRTDSILKRALAVEKGDATPPCPTEEHPDGLDLSLYKEESQLKKGKPRKRKASPIKASKRLVIDKSPEQAKVRKIEPPAKSAALTKALVLKKALAAKTKQTTVVNKVFKPRPTTTEMATKTSPIIDHQKAKVLAKFVKKPTVATSPVQSLPSTSIKPQLPRKQSVKSTDTVVPFLKKDPPLLKKEGPSVKKEFLVLKKESLLIKKEIPLKKDIVVKKPIDIVKKDAAPAVKREMPVLKKEVPLGKREVVSQKSVSTRKSIRGKK